MEFVLPVPRYWFSPGFADGDWIYLAGGIESGGDRVNAFEKYNVITGEIVQLMELRRPVYCCHLIKY